MQATIYQQVRCRQRYINKFCAHYAGLGLKAVWYGAEQFGNVLGLTKKRQTESKGAERPQQASLFLQSQKFRITSIYILLLILFGLVGCLYLAAHSSVSMLVRAM